MGKKITANQKLAVKLVRLTLEYIDSYPDSLILELYRKLGTALIHQYPRADGPDILELSWSNEICQVFQEGLDFLQNGSNDPEMEKLKKEVDSYIKKYGGRGLFLSWVKGKLKSSEETFRSNSRQQYF